MRDLGALPGGTLSFAWDINADGVVTGAAEHPDRADDPELRLSAVAWIDGAIVDLNDAIPADSHWVLNSAYAINDAGRASGDQAARKDIYFRLQEILAEDLARIFLFYPPSNLVRQSYLKGLPAVNSYYHIADAYFEFE
jgi:ABC-type transport system substrate-binding protein